MTKQARRVFGNNGRLLGVHVPYNPDFVTAAKAAGYIWTGKRFGDYWHYDERLLVDGRLTNEELREALEEKRQALIPLVEQFYAIEETPR